MGVVWGVELPVGVVFGLELPLGLVFGVVFSEESALGVEVPAGGTVILSVLSVGFAPRLSERERILNDNVKCGKNLTVR